MTAATAAPPVPSLADLVLVRMALPSNTPKKVREDVGKLFDRGLSEEEFNDIRNDLAAAGLLAKGKRNTFTLTDAGRAEMLRLLDVAELPPRTNWDKVVARWLLPRASKEAAKLDSAEKLKAHVLQQKYGLQDAGNTVKRVMDALVRQELGFPDEPKFETIYSAILSKVVGSDRRLSKKDLERQVVRYETGLTDPQLTQAKLRAKLVRDWFRGQRTATPNDTPLVPEPAEAFDLAAFAGTVVALARSSPPADRFHDNKVFISAVWQASQREPGFPRLSLADFKTRLREANATGLLHLSRADLVQAMDPRLVAESETTYLNATFHFVRLEGGAA